MFITSTFKKAWSRNRMERSYGWKRNTPFLVRDGLTNRVQRYKKDLEYANITQKKCPERHFFVLSFRYSLVHYLLVSFKKVPSLNTSKKTK